ncbi:hypothetical protein AB5I41_04630 [Sphingomonas sp. MMS24-JH45]
MRAITNRRANTYRIQPRRVFTGVDQATMDALYRAMNADAVLKKASRYVKLWGGAAASRLQRCDRHANAERHHAERAGRALQRPREPGTCHHHARRDPRRRRDLFRLDCHRLPAPRTIAACPARSTAISATPNPYGVLPFVPLFDRLPDDQFFLPAVTTWSKRKTP